MFTRESPEIHEALVADLSKSIVPTTIMGVTLVGVGLLASVQIDAATFLPVTIAAGLASIAKAAFIEFHRVRIERQAMGGAAASRIELVHALLTVTMAASVGAVGTLLFRVPDVNAHLIATALLFAYCSGIVSRLSIRPLIAAAAITTAALPCVAAAWFVGDMAHNVLSLIFLVFLLGAMESIAHAHRSATHHIAMRVRMASIARHDPLTGLLNRFGLREAFDALPVPSRICIHAFDLDRFKPVNDLYGHQGGDTVLKDIAERLRAIAAPGVIIARVGGDEFVVIQPDLRYDTAADALAGRIHEALVQPYDLGQASVKIGVSIGYAIGSPSEASLEAMLRDADRASYLVKRDGGGFRAHRA